MTEKPNIWRLQAQSDTQGLIDALKDSDPDIRKRAAVALRTLGATRAVPALEDALAVETDQDARVTIVTALERLLEDTEAPEQQAEVSEMARLLANLNSTQVEEAVEAARALGKLKDKIVVEPLIVIFRDRTRPPSLRLSAAEALLELESAPVEVSLLAALRNPKWHIRRNAAAILGQLKAEWAVEPLTKALRDESEFVRKTARAALKHMGSPEALAVLRLLTPEPLKSADASATKPPVSAVPDPTTAKDTQLSKAIASPTATTAPSAPTSIPAVDQSATPVAPITQTTPVTAPMPVPGEEKPAASAGTQEQLAVSTPSPAPVATPADTTAVPVKEASNAPSEQQATQQATAPTLPVTPGAPTPEQAANLVKPTQETNIATPVPEQATPAPPTEATTGSPEVEPVSVASATTSEKSDIVQEETPTAAETKTTSSTAVATVSSVPAGETATPSPATQAVTPVQSEGEVEVTRPNPSAAVQDEDETQPHRPPSLTPPTNESLTD